MQKKSLLGQQLQSDIAKTLAEDLNDIVNILLEAQIEKPIELTIAHHANHEESMELKYFIADTLHYALEEPYFYTAFIEFMPYELLNEVSELFDTKHPSSLTCNKIASIIVKYKGIKVFSKLFLKKFAIEFPELAAKINIEDL